MYECVNAAECCVECSPPVHQAELQQLEDLLHKERKERERIVASYRKQVEERKAQIEKADRRVRPRTGQGA